MSLEKFEDPRESEEPDTPHELQLLLLHLDPNRVKNELQWNRRRNVHGEPGDQIVGLDYLEVSNNLTVSVDLCVCVAHAWEGVLVVAISCYWW